VLTIQHSKSFQGKISLPPSSDLFCVAAFAALAAKQAVRIGPIKDAPLIRKWAAIVEPQASVTWEEDACCIEPFATNAAAPIVFEDDAIPYRDLVLFMALGARFDILFRKVTDKRLEAWAAQAKRLGCSVETIQSGEARGMKLAGSAAWESISLSPAEDDLHPLLGMLLGVRAKFSFQTDFNLSTPFRPLVKVLGYDLSVKRDIGEAERDPIIRRMRIQARQRLSSQDQLFTVHADFSKSSCDERPAIRLPGDEVLLGMLLLAKSLIVKGSLVIDNAPLESWATPMASLMRKMGCKLSQQESADTAFGPAGMLSFQKYDVTGQKTEGSPNWWYAFQAPAMAVLAAFAEGESVFRRLDDLRLSDPDGIQQIEQCLKILNVKHGDMPDGFVIKGANEYDGFDLIEPLPAPIAGAFAVAGLHAVGATSINDEKILERWPDFDKTIMGLCEFRT
jgi:hypothetical protein